MARMTADDMKLVYWVIDKHFKQYLHDEDMIQVGALAMVECDVKLGEAFSESSTYVVTAIKRKIISEYHKREKHSDLLSLDSTAPNNRSGRVLTYYDVTEGVNLSEESFDLPDFLTEKEKFVVRMRDAGYVDQEIGTMLGMTRAGVCRIRKRIKEKLKQNGYLVERKDRYGRSKRGRKSSGDEGTNSGK